MTDKIHIRVCPEFIHDIDLLRKSEADLPSRSEMIRRLAERGRKALETDKKRRS